MKINQSMAVVLPCFSKIERGASRGTCLASCALFVGSVNCLICFWIQVPSRFAMDLINQSKGLDGWDEMASCYWSTIQ